MFNPVQYEKEHLIRLYESGKKALNNNSPAYKRNLRRTISKWVDNHKNTAHVKELQMLIELHQSI